MIINYITVNEERKTIEINKEQFDTISCAGKKVGYAFYGSYNGLFISVYGDIKYRELIIIVENAKACIESCKNNTINFQKAPRIEMNSLDTDIIVNLE